MAVAESALLLGEPLTPALFVATGLVVAGLYLTNKPRRWQTRVQPGFFSSRRPDASIASSRRLRSRPQA